MESPQARLAPFYLRTGHVVAAIVLAVVFAWMTHVRMWHTDVWAHLRFGEFIAQEHRLPDHEPFASCADHSAPYVNYQWLTQLGAYLLFEAGSSLAIQDFEHRLGGGVLFLQTAHALVVTLRLFVLLLAFRRLTGSLPFALLGVLAVLVMGWLNHIPVIRPQILGELAFAALLLALSRPPSPLPLSPAAGERGWGEGLSRRALLWVPFVFLLWANCHGSFPVGFVLLGVALLGQIIDMARSRLQTSEISGTSDVWRLPAELIRDVQTRRLAAVLLLSLLAAMVNPHGPKLFVYGWELARNPNISSVKEWNPLPVQGLIGYVFLVSVLVVVPLLRWSPARFSATQTLLLVIFGWQSLGHVRMLVWWIMVVVWVALPHARAVYLRYLPPLRDEKRQPNLAKTILAVLAVGALVLWSAPAQWLVFREAPTGSMRVSRETPVKLAQLLREMYDSNPTLSRHIFASETEGEYLLWDLRRMQPPVCIFAYTHVHLFKPKHWREFLLVKSGDHHWQEILDEHKVQFIVVEYDDRNPNSHAHLVEHVRTAKHDWQVLSDSPPPIFAAKRKQ